MKKLVVLSLNLSEGRYSIDFCILGDFYNDPDSLAQSRGGGDIGCAILGYWDIFSTFVHSKLNIVFQRTIHKINVQMGKIMFWIYSSVLNNFVQSFN